MTLDGRTRHETPTHELRERALMYSLRMLDPEIAAEFQQHLESGCEVCESEVRAFNDAAAQTVHALPEVSPGAGVREKLMNLTGGRRPPAAFIVREQEGAWQPLPYPGVTAKQLHFDRETGYFTSLVRMLPGSVYPSHNHVKPEHCYVLEGDCTFEDHILFPGDYEVASPSTHHTVSTTKNGCLMLIINNIQNLQSMGSHSR